MRKEWNSIRRFTSVLVLLCCGIVSTACSSTADLQHTWKFDVDKQIAFYKERQAKSDVQTTDAEEQKWEEAKRKSLSEDSATFTDVDLRHGAQFAYHYEVVSQQGDHWVLKLRMKDIPVPAGMAQMPTYTAGIKWIDKTHIILEGIEPKYQATDGKSYDQVDWYLVRDK